MSGAPPTPRILIIDDVFGRVHADRRNAERASLCGQLLLEDRTGDEVGIDGGMRIKRPVAQAVFFRGQRPAASRVGDLVENDLEQCLEVVRRGWTDQAEGQPPWALVLLDLCFYTGRVTEASNRNLLGMPEGREDDDEPRRYFGLIILQAIRDRFPDLPVVILSSKSRGEVSRDIDARGALGFIPRGEPGTRETLEEYIWRHGLLPDTDGGIMGHSIPLLKALRAARRAAESSRNVLLRGETGTGKELLAAYLHRNSPERKDGPFVAVDSGALSGELYGSELFGHRKGAFTGAGSDRTGRIVQASGGDLFLDEIANMPADVQTGLMRVLQERNVVPVGADKGVEVDVRFLSATNEDIEGKGLLGQFRFDLLTRLCLGATITLPALRERREDIPLLVERFLRDAVAENPRTRVREVSREAIEMLTALDWPGNVRALESCVRGAVGSHPDVEYLYPHHFQVPGHGAPRVTVARVPVEQEPAPSLAGAGRRPVTLDEALEILEALDFEGFRGPDLAGALARVQGSCARFVARLMTAALEATRRPTPEDPEGKVLIHPAMKLLTGNPKLTATKAADLINRLLSLDPEGVAGLLQDGPLRDAQRKARELRGGRGARSGKAREAPQDPD